MASYLSNLIIKNSISYFVIRLDIHLKLDGNCDVEGGVVALSPDGDEDVCWSIIRTRKQDIRLIALKQQSICNQFGNGGDFMGSAAFLSFAITVLVLDTLKQQSIIPSWPSWWYFPFAIHFDILVTTISINAWLKLSVSKYSNNEISIIPRWCKVFQNIQTPISIIPRWCKVFQNIQTPKSIIPRWCKVYQNIQTPISIIPSWCRVFQKQVYQRSFNNIPQPRRLTTTRIIGITIITMFWKIILRC